MQQEEKRLEGYYYLSDDKVVVEWTLYREHNKQAQLLSL
ncbi:hypothetical protein CTM76_00895 [Photobacterium phosphoreum]|nr:hypothetical protein [Photobacterium phosphoreum]MCD9483289.1 hypothetical protein [Photobacterium phosphoreum]MCD9501458.1 hypothetical protein [Photobacterium phosphoreum]MCD9509757.1 hypothetical protein [Photobacterium phosphoreum]MCD9519396.1 hypothetical protein [Photobacterium phosphoreum]